MQAITAELVDSMANATRHDPVGELYLWRHLPLSAPDSSTSYMPCAPGTATEASEDPAVEGRAMVHEYQGAENRNGI
jgi:hypothetical protein